MSGLCGWFSREPAALPIVDMAAGLCRFDQAPLRTGTNGAGALALAGQRHDGTLYHEDGLLVACWGEGVEALARMWRAHGAGACAALSGQFAFALLDERRGEALLAVDRAATRPLYYQQVGHTLLFATCGDALALHPGAGREVDQQAIYNYLYFRALPGPGAMYRGQRRLAPGEFVHMHGGRLERGRYWRLRFQEHQGAAPAVLKDGLAGSLREALAASKGEQQVGVMLGGGACSAALAALLQEAPGTRAQTFACGAGPAARGTLAAARSAARLLGSEHHERELCASDAADAIPKLAALYDQPCGEPGALAAYHCALLAREAGVRRLLTGHGGAVLFGHGPRYARQQQLASYERLPSMLRQLVLEPVLFRLAGGVRSGPLAAARGRIEHAMQPLPARLLHANLLEGYGAGEVLDPGFLEAVDAGAPRAALDQAWWGAQGREEVNRMIALDLQYTLAGHGLPLAARALEGAGVDAAFPWLADPLLAFAAQVEPRHKRTDGLLAQALRGMVGARLAAACGGGFEVPLGQWLQSDPRLRSLAFDTLAALRRRHIVRASFIDTLLQQLPEQPSRHGRMVWLLMMLELWFATRKASLGHRAARLREPATVGQEEPRCAC